MMDICIQDSDVMMISVNYDDDILLYEHDYVAEVRLCYRGMMVRLENYYR